MPSIVMGDIPHSHCKTFVVFAETWVTRLFDRVWNRAKCNLVSRLPDSKEQDA